MDEGGVVRDQRVAISYGSEKRGRRGVRESGGVVYDIEQRAVWLL